jgi:hypothetical protein
MNKDLYQFPERGMNATIPETLAMMRLLNEHGIFAGFAQIEMVASKNATATDQRTIPIEHAERAGFEESDPLYITFQIGREGRTTAGHLGRLFRFHGNRAMIQRLYQEHVSAEEGAWERHLLSLPAVQRAVERAFR